MSDSEDKTKSEPLSNLHNNASFIFVSYAAPRHSLLFLLTLLLLLLLLTGAAPAADPNWKGDGDAAAAGPSFTSNELLAGAALPNAGTLLLPLC